MSPVCTAERVRILHQIGIVARVPKDYRAIVVKSLNIHARPSLAATVARVPSRYIQIVFRWLFSRVHVYFYGRSFLQRLRCIFDRLILQLRCNLQMGFDWLMLFFSFFLSVVYYHHHQYRITYLSVNGSAAARSQENNQPTKWLVIVIDKEK